jgi:uncharacterized RDD family membrane protein YckC
VETNGDVLARRIAAFLIDSVLLGAIWGGFAIGASVLGDAASLALLSVGVVAVLGYALLLEGIYGYTPGKYLLGLVVVGSDGSNCTIGASVLRNLAWVVDSLPTANLVAMASILLTDDNQRIGDLVANTVVVARR